MTRNFPSMLFHLFLLVLPYLIFGMSILASVIGDMLLQAILILAGILALLLDIEGQHEIVKIARGR